MDYWGMVGRSEERALRHCCALFKVSLQSFIIGIDEEGQMSIPRLRRLNRLDSRSLCLN